MAPPGCSWLFGRRQRLVHGRRMRDGEGWSALQAVQRTRVGGGHTGARCAPYATTATIMSQCRTCSSMHAGASVGACTTAVITVMGRTLMGTALPHRKMAKNASKSTWSCKPSLSYDHTSGVGLPRRNSFSVYNVSARLLLQLFSQPSIQRLNNFNAALAFLSFPLGGPFATLEIFTA